MTLFENLAAIGLTTTMLQYIIFGGIAIIVAGVFWNYIVAGAGILFCAYVLVSPMTTSSVAQVVVTPVDAAPLEFIEDCIRYNDNVTKAICEKSWKDYDKGSE